VKSPGQNAGKPVKVFGADLTVEPVLEELVEFDNLHLAVLLMPTRYVPHDPSLSNAREGPGNLLDVVGPRQRTDFPNFGFRTLICAIVFQISFSS
jgi:hypothetical protein